jgi:hypothetical protein
MVIPVMTQHYANVAAKPSLHRRHAGQAAGRVGRPEEGCRHRRPKCLGATKVVEVAGMAPPQPIFIAADRRDELSHDSYAFGPLLLARPE